MKDSVACAAFAGFFVSPWFSDASSQMSRLLKRIYSQRGWKSTRIVQWDSWRFWESLASGCVTFHLDLEKYGALAPVMPENWRHYIGIDLNNIPETVNRLTDEPELLEKISAAGRQWVLENYSPIPVAQRFLQTIS